MTLPPPRLLGFAGHDVCPAKSTAPSAPGHRRGAPLAAIADVAPNAMPDKCVVYNFPGIWSVICLQATRRAADGAPDALLLGRWIAVQVGLREQADGRAGVP